METTELNTIFEEVKNELPPLSDKKFVGIETIITILLINGMKLLLPEMQEWIKLGFSAIVTKRLIIEEKLKKFALEKELNYEQAKIVAEKIAQKVNENNIESIITELKSK